VDQVRRIRLLLAAGLPTKRIARALGGLCEQGSRLAPCPGLVADLRQDRERIDQTITALQASRDVLDGVIAAAPLHHKAQHRHVLTG
jgi:DNA-binding transcriptional MerR regulator